MSYCGNRVPAEFVGQTTDTLMAWLTEAQIALHQLQTFKVPVSLTYDSGSGNKSVTYHVGDIDPLRQRIRDLAIALCLTPRRHAMNPGF